MKKKRYTEAPIVSLLTEGESGVPVSELCRKHGMSVSDLQRLKQLESENQRLKQMHATLSMDHELLKEVLGKKYGVDLSDGN